MIKLKRFLLILGLGVCLVGATGLSRGQGGEEGWQVYTDANSVNDMALEGGGALGGGYTWAATAGGVVCYSASQQVKFTTLDGLVDNYTRAIVEDSGGRWWVGTYNGGVSVLDDRGTPFDKGDDMWTTFARADGLASEQVNAIAVGGSGYLWFGTGGGVSVLDGGGTPVEKGDDRWITFTTADGLTHSNVFAIAVDGEGRWWFGPQEGGVSMLDDGGTPFDKRDDNWITFTTADGLAPGDVLAIAVDGRGRLWFGTHGGGVSVLDYGGTPFYKGDDIWATFTSSDGLVVDYVWVVTEDSGGRLWFGTFYRGVSVLDHGGTPFDKNDDNWITFSTADGLMGDRVRAIAVDSLGQLWFSAERGGGVSVLDDGGTPFDKRDDTWITFTESDGLASNLVQTVFVDSRGLLWFGIQGFGTPLGVGGVSVLNDGGTPFNKGDDIWTTFTYFDGLASNDVVAIFVDNEGRLWFSSPAGGSVLDTGETPFDKRDDTWATFRKPDGLVDYDVHTILVDSRRKVWFGTDGGVSVLDNGGTPFAKADDTWTSFTTTDGLVYDYVCSIAEDSKGRLWFGTYGGGVSVLDGGRTPFDKGDDTWVHFTTADGLADNHVMATVADGVRRWFGTGGGVSVLDDGGTPFDKGDDTWITFTTADGLADDYVGAILVDSRGRRWFSTWGGASVLDDGGTPFDKTDDTWASLTMVDGLADHTVRAIAEDSGRRLWFGTAYGARELMDAVAPVSSASSPAYVASGTIPVSWSASDGASHVFRATLWVKYRSTGTWTETGLSQRGQSAGTFYYTPTLGDGIYYFATVAEDWMGNVEATPTGTGDTSTIYGRTGDSYEPDDTCVHARPIPTDGSAQVHTFHGYADADWVRFDATSGVTYLIEAQIPADSPADVALGVYDRCGGLPQDEQDHAFSPGVRLEFTAPADGPLYLELSNHDPSVYGPQAAYHLSVRALADASTPGAVVIVAGKLRDGDRLQPNIHYVTNAVYRLFLAHGYDGGRIHYLATDVTMDPDGDGTSDVDGLPTLVNLRQAITSWAVGKVGPGRPLTLYLTDHGNYDLFYLNGSTQTVSPQDVDGWLETLEASVPGVQVNVIVEACHSGSFIDSASANRLVQTVSGPGRVVITSTAARNLAYASQEGAAFSDSFVQALGRGTSLYGSFQEARWAVQEAHPDQTPWLDDDGDGRPNQGADGQGAAGRGFAYAGALGDAWPPYVVWAGIEEGVIEAEVRDDVGVSRVWAVVYPPSYQPPDPATTEELVQEGLPEVPLSDGDGDGVYSAVYSGFDEAGAYRVVVYAVDGEGLVGRPKGVEVHQLYLPLVVSNYAPPVTFPVHVGGAIPVRAVAYQGEVFYTASVRMPDAWPSGGHFYFSSQPDAVTEVVVDDELAVLLGGAELFTYRFSSAGTSPEPAIVEVPRAVLAGLAGRTVTVEYRDVYGDVVEASAMWLIWRP
jgi:ligand-binding sensor domain-containing protein